MLIFAMAIFVLIGVVALSIDGGYILAERRQAQNAADAGALAAAKSLFANKTGEIDTAARAYAQSNAGATSNVVPEWPPKSGPYAGNQKYVRVQITKQVEKFFVGAVYPGTWQVTASAVAGIETEPADYALITLDKKAPVGIQVNGTTGIYIYGGKSSAMSNTTIEGVGSSKFQTPGTIDANGAINGAKSSNWNPEDRQRSGLPQIDDPFKATGVTPPDSSLLANRSFISATDCPARKCKPGVYANQSFDENSAWTFEPGAYYFQNTDISLKNNGSLTGDGVTFYFDKDSSFYPKNGEVNLKGNLTSATYAGGKTGLVFWYAACDQLDLQGNGNMSYTGIFYAPCAEVWMHGNTSSDTIDGQIIVGTLDIRGNSTMNIHYNKYVDTEQPRIFLVE